MRRANAMLASASGCSVRWCRCPQRVHVIPATGSAHKVQRRRSKALLVDSGCILVFLRMHQEGGTAAIRGGLECFFQGFALRIELALGAPWRLLPGCRDPIRGQLLMLTSWMKSGPTGFHG